MKKSLEEQIMYKLRTIHNSVCQSLLSQTQTIRVIKMFPKNTNQASRKILCYSYYGNFVYAHDFTYCSFYTFKDLLPQRIGIFEDYCYMSKKDYNFYKVGK